MKLHLDLRLSDLKNAHNVTVSFVFGPTVSITDNLVIWFRVQGFGRGHLSFDMFLPSMVTPV